MRPPLPALAWGTSACVLFASCLEARTDRSSQAKLGEVEISVTYDPSPVEDVVPTVVRIALGSNRTLSASSVSVFRGQLSARELKDLAMDRASKTLQSRQVPVLSWEQGDQLIVAPTVRLEAGQTYSIALPEWSWSQAFTTSGSDDAPYLKRVWPPAESSGTASLAVWCLVQPAEGRVSNEHRSESLLPLGAVGELSFGAIDQLGKGCVRWMAAGGEPAGVLVPPLTAMLEDGQVARIDPTPLALTGEVPIEVEPICAEPRQALGPGCGLVQDDRVIVTVGDGAWWLGAELGSVSWTGALDPQNPAILRALAPSTEYELKIGAIDRAGRRRDWRGTFRTAEKHSHVVLNEIMANPEGPEPDQEWVEIVNDGLAPVQLEGWILEDSGGETVLPPCELEPGRFALIVNESYRADSWVDRAPAAGAQIVRVSKLGVGGLSNSGEPLRLRSIQGQIASSVPALASPKASVSIARVRPEALDDLPGSFERKDSGGTPGEANTR